MITHVCGAARALFLALIVARFIVEILIVVAAVVTLVVAVVVLAWWLRRHQAVAPAPPDAAPVVEVYVTIAGRSALACPTCLPLALAGRVEAVRPVLERGSR